jgi:hypothetical protein
VTSDRDYGDEQPQPLFDVTITVPKRCTCGTTKKNLCVYDADLEHGQTAPRRRPRTCLNHPQNREGIPY